MPSSRPSGRSRWAAQMGLSLVDQAASAGAHLGVHLALGRILEPAQYGVFAILFAVLLFLAGAHSALLAEPMSVIGPARYGDREGAYIRSHVRLHALAAAVLVLALALAGAVAAWWTPALAASLAGLAGAGGGYLSYLLLRRACYILGRPRIAAIGSGLYALVLLGGLIVLHRLAALVPAAVLLVIGVAGFVGAGATRALLPLGDDDAPPPPLRRVWAEDWNYGRWILAANLAHWAGSGAYLFLVGAVAGLAEAGAFRALQTLISPAQQVLAALALLVLPVLSRQRPTPPSGPVDTSRLIRLWTPVVLAVALYGLLLSIWGTPVTAWIYDQPRYTDAAALLPIFAVFIVMAAVTNGLTLGVRSAQRSKPVFWSKLAATVVALGLGIVATWRWGLAGAAWGMVLSMTAEGVVLIAATRGADR